MREYTQFLGQGKMLFMIFGLPAAAYAIYKTSPGEKKNKVKALMIAGVAASIVSGITEPLEFAFLCLLHRHYSYSMRLWVVSPLC